MKTKSLLLLPAFAVSTVFCQEKMFNSDAEIFSHFSFNNSITTTTTPTTGYLQIDRTYRFTVQPAFGYFLTETFELLFEPRYTLLYTNSETSTGFYRGSNSQWDHRLGFRTGLLLNFKLSSSIATFLGTKYGLSWTRSDYDGNYLYRYSHWGKPETTFPDVLIGTRFLLTKSLHLLISAEYERIKPYNYKNGIDRNNKSIVVLFGFAVGL